MKKLFFLLTIIFVVVVFTSCDTPTTTDKTTQFYSDINGKLYQDYNECVTATMNQLKPPIILIAKEEDFVYGCSVTLVDSNKRIVTFGNRSLMSRQIGKSHNINDTIVK